MGWLTNFQILFVQNKIMSEIKSYSDFSKNGIVTPIGITGKKTATKGLFAVGAILFAITTMVGWFMISGSQQFPISYLMLNLFLWGTSLVLLLYAYNHRYS